MNKYMLIYRSPAANKDSQPSPEEMEGMLKQWADWKEKFKESILDMGDGLKAEGRVLRADSNVTDGPFVEAKEVLGGFSIIQAENFEKAIDVARTCPFQYVPEYSIEIRELACY